MRLEDLAPADIRWALPLDFKSYDKTFGIDLISTLLDWMDYRVSDPVLSGVIRLFK